LGIVERVNRGIGFDTAVGQKAVCWWSQLDTSKATVRSLVTLTSEQAHVHKLSVVVNRKTDGQIHKPVGVRIKQDAGVTGILATPVDLIPTPVEETRVRGRP
jgi:hypothetical protein